MNPRLQAEYRRLFELPDASARADSTRLGLVNAGGQVRTLVMGLRRPADWTVLSAVWHGVQADLELPAPAIVVNGVDAFELWFSLAEPVPLAQSLAFLVGLRERYLNGVKPQRLELCPAEAIETQSTLMTPAVQGESGNWSAFVAPDLAAVFGDEPQLDVPPGFDAQADVLSRLTSIQPAEFEAALLQLQPADSYTVAAQSTSATPANAQQLAAAGRFEDPRLFLLDVMNNNSVVLSLRIEAAKILIQR